MLMTILLAMKFADEDQMYYEDVSDLEGQRMSRAEFEKTGVSRATPPRELSGGSPLTIPEAEIGIDDLSLDTSERPFADRLRIWQARDVSRCEPAGTTATTENSRLTSLGEECGGEELPSWPGRLSRSVAEARSGIAASEPDEIRRRGSAKRGPAMTADARANIETSKSGLPDLALELPSGAPALAESEAETQKNTFEKSRLDIGVAEETPATTLKSESEAVQGVAMLKQNPLDEKVDMKKELADHMQFESLSNL